MKYKYSLKDATTFGWEGLQAKAYNSKDDFPNASAAVFELTSQHGKVKTTLSDRVYCVLEGEGVFWIDGEEVTVEKTDVVIVPKNTPYNYWAKQEKLKMFLVHSPAYDEKFEVSLEKDEQPS